MGWTSRFYFCLIVSVLLHAAVVWWWPVAKPVRSLPMVLEVELVSQVSPPANESAPAQTLEPLPEETPPEVPIAPRPPPEIATEIVVRPIENQVQLESAARALNLKRPANWKKIIDSTVSAADAKTFAFAPELQSGVAARRETRSRQQFLAARHRAVNGLSPEEYRHIDAFGEVFKTEHGCVYLREDPILGGGQQWWFTPCLDPRISAFLLPELEVDAKGRAIAPSGP